MGYNVAVDGPAGAGKSTIAKLVAKEKGLLYPTVIFSSGSFAPL